MATAAAPPRPAMRRRPQPRFDHRALRRVVQVGVAAVVAVAALERAAAGPRQEAAD